MSQKLHSNKNAASVYITNLNRKVTEKTLQQIFSSYGTIRRCEVVRGPGGIPKGYGFVHYEKESSAAACITALNGLLLIDRRIMVEYVTSLEERKQAELMCELFVRNLPANFTDEQLKDRFQVFGTIVKHRVTVTADGKSAHGHVAYTTPTSAECAMQMLNGVRVDNSELKVEYASKMEQEKRVAQPSIAERGVNLFVNRLDRSIDSKKLQQIFSRFGTIKSVKVMIKSGRPQGYGFVRFATAEEAINAIAAMNGEKVANKALQVSLAQCRSDRSANTEVVQSIANMVIQNTFEQQRSHPSAADGLVPLPVPNAPSSISDFTNNSFGMYVRNALLKAVSESVGGQPK